MNAELTENDLTKKIPLWLIAITIMLPTAFAMLATSATNVAIPHIAGAFGSTQDESNWVITSYMIANAILLPLTGWLENMMGRRLFLKVFIAMFTVGALICTISTSLNMLIIGRIIQGIGGGPLMPISQAILLESFPYEKRGNAMAIFAFAVMISSILGPSYGGFIVDNLNWQWIFLMNLPIGVFSILLIDRNIKEKEHRIKPKKVDYVGLTALVTWLLTMQVVLDKGQQFGWFDAQWICITAGVSIFAMVFFIVWELEYKDAIVNLRVFKDLNFAIGTILSASINMIIYVTIVLLPMFLQSLMGYSALISGFSLAPRALSCIIMLPIASRLVNIIDNRVMIATGFFFLGFSTFMYTNLNLSTSFTYIIIPNVLMGVGVILIFIPISAIALGTLPKSELANGAGLHSLAKCVATSFVVSFSSTLIARLSQIHQTNLVGNLSIYKSTFHYKIGALSHKLAVYYPHVVAIKKSNGILYKQLLVQSRLMAFSDVFAIFALLAFILLPFSFLLTVKPRKE